MNTDLAEHISLLAAPIFAAMLAPHLAIGRPIITADSLTALRKTAIEQAHALWLDVLETRE